MRISSYSFGEIVIDGITYTSDVIVFEDKVNSSWWREQGHLLKSNDLKEVIEAKPDLLIIGTGHSGAMKVPPETREFLTSQGIEFVIQKTEDACTTFNEAPLGKNTVAALHLTC